MVNMKNIWSFSPSVSASHFYTVLRQLTSEYWLGFYIYLLRLKSLLQLPVGGKTEMLQVFMSDKPIWKQDWREPFVLPQV